MGGRAKKTKDKYIVTSTLAGEDNTGLPGILWGKIALTKSEAGRIVALVGQVRALKDQFAKRAMAVYSLEFWDYSCEYFVGFKGDDTDTEEIKAVEESDYCVTETPPEGEETYRVCVEILRVMDDGVLWTAQDKYNNNPIETQHIPLSVFMEFLEGLDK